MPPLMRALAKAALPSLGLAASTLPAHAATGADVKAHVAAAERAAGEAFLRLCPPAPVARPKVGDEGLAKLIATPGPEAAAAFDNCQGSGVGSAPPAGPPT